MTSPFFVRIFRRDSNGDLTGEIADGSLHPLNIDVAELHPGDVLRVQGDRWEQVDKTNWVERHRIGVVRAVTGDNAVVETDGEVVSAGNPSGLSLAVGNTVRIDIRSTVVDVVSPDEIRRLPIQIDRDEDGFDVDLLIQDTSMATLEWENFGGLTDLVDHAKEIVEVHLKRREDYADIGATPLRGVIFEGPPGTGKTYLARIMAHKAEATLYVVGAPELGGRLVGESEGRLQKLYDHASKNKLSIIFIDELDSITHQRGESGGSHSDRLVSTFLVNMDGFRAKDNVLTIGTTNRIDDIDVALRRPGRFGTEFRFRKPDKDDRLAILQARSASMRTLGELSHMFVAEATGGWSGADLDEIWTHAATYAIKANCTAIADVHYVMGLERVQMLRPREEERE